MDRFSSERLTLICHSERMEESNELIVRIIIESPLLIKKPLPANLLQEFFLAQKLVQNDNVGRVARSE